MPAPGSRNHLGEVRKQLPADWAAYLAGSRGVVTDSEAGQLTAQLETGIANLQALFDKLDRAYDSANDKERLTLILEDDWPPVITTSPTYSERSVPLSAR